MAWLESRPVNYLAAREHYYRAGDESPVYHTQLFSLKRDHDTLNSYTGCYMCGRINLPNYATVHQLIVIEDDEQS